MSDPAGAARVSAVEIARLAGVGRAAVSNWRRRHPDFPRPVGGSETSPAFSLTEVEAWLRAQGKIAEVPLRERVRQQLERLRHPADSPAAPLVPALALLLLLQRDPDRWQSLAPRPDQELATDLPAALGLLAVRTLGPDGARLLRLPALYGSTQLGLARLLAEYAADFPGGDGPQAAATELTGGPADSAHRPGAALSAEVAALMGRLARTDAPDSLYDPACGGGTLLLAAGSDGRGDVHCGSCHGQEADPDLAAVALLRLALRCPLGVPLPLPLHLAAGDALRAEAALPGVNADAVLSRPPYNERNWGADELAYDPRWEYGLPARADSELAWAQHCLARVRPGGLVVLLLPGAVAARRSGRRVRADLLRRGALRAVLALPTGVAAPAAVPLHLWLLRRPVSGEPAPLRVLLADVSGSPEDYPEAVLDAWQGYESGRLPDLPGVHRAVPVIDLLDDAVDLTPARHLPQRPADAHGLLTAQQQRLAALLAQLAPPAAALPGHRPGDRSDGDGTAAGGELNRSASTVGELLRGGGLELLGEGEPVRAGDVVLPAPGGAGTGGGGGGSVAAEVHAGPPVPAPRGAQVLRPDPAVLDPWFLAGFLGVALRAERSGGTGSGTTLSRRDVRRARVPRLLPAEQRRYAAPFRQLALFERGLAEAATLGEQLAQGIAAGFADGSLRPEE